MSELRQTGLRRLTAALMRHNARTMPPHRRIWAAAMEHEGEHIEEDLGALTWAIGCVAAGYWERLTSHAPQLASNPYTSKGNAMEAQQMNHISSKVLLALSLIALFPVAVPFVHNVLGHPMAPAHDEDALAHIFQLAVGLSGLALLLCLVTINWKHPAHSLRALTIPVAVLALALAGVRLMHL